MENLERRLEGMRRQDNFYPWSSEPQVSLFLYSLIRLTDARTVLELGTFKGASTICMAEAVKSNGGGMVYTIDHEDYGSENIEKSGLSDYITYIIGDDIEELKDLDVIFDLAFIDTDHKEGHARNEFYAVQQKTKIDGLITFHDSISHPGVSKVIDEIQTLKEFETITLPTVYIEERKAKSLPSGLSIVRKIGNYNNFLNET